MSQKEEVLIRVMNIEGKYWPHLVVFNGSHAFSLGREHNEAPIHGSHAIEVINHHLDDNSQEVQGAEGEWNDEQPEDAQQDPNYIEGHSRIPHCLQKLGADEELEKTCQEQGLSLLGRACNQ